MNPDSFTITRVNILGMLFQSHTSILYFLLLLSLLHHGNILVFVMLLHARGHYFLKYQHLSGPYLCPRTIQIQNPMQKVCFLGTLLATAFFLPGFPLKAVPKTRSCFQDVQIGKHESGKWRKPIHGALWSPGWDIRA